MTTNLTLVILMAVLVACGVTLLLERSLTRILVGVLLLSNGVNLFFLVASGPAGNAPVLGSVGPGPMSDPLPQAMVLTAIVITLGVSAFLLAMAYRSWQLGGDDEVQDDVEDALITRLAERDETSSTFDGGSDGELDEEGADT
ncbi:MAG: Na(+)/H(+) antiporter subunit C [Nocardioidaceae bacterium]|nr:Na(+)/H(+) antiporter subunit C [Nocardioidaceae bacterium]